MYKNNHDFLTAAKSAAFSWEETLVAPLIAAPTTPAFCHF
jgi:hypothetical protein